MATLSDAEVRWIARRIASGVLTVAGDPERAVLLKRAIRDWVPNCDRFDEIELRRVVPLVAKCLHALADGVDRSRERMEADGRAADPNGPGAGAARRVPGADDAG